MSHQTLSQWVEATRSTPAAALTTDERTGLVQFRREVVRLREQRDILKKPRPSSPNTASSVEFIQEERANHRVRVLCRSLPCRPVGFVPGSAEPAGGRGMRIHDCRRLRAPPRTAQPTIAPRKQIQEHRQHSQPSGWRSR